MQPSVYEQPDDTDTMADDSDMSPLSLSVTDLSSILKWSKEISSDINLAAGECFDCTYDYPSRILAALQRFTEISAGVSPFL